MNIFNEIVITFKVHNLIKYYLYYFFLIKVSDCKQTYINYFVKISIYFFIKFNFLNLKKIIYIYIY